MWRNSFLNTYGFHTRLEESALIKLNLQQFAHKNGMGSTRNGRDSESKRIGP